MKTMQIKNIPSDTQKSRKIVTVNNMRFFGTFSSELCIGKQFLDIAFIFV